MDLILEISKIVGKENVFPTLLNVWPTHAIYQCMRGYRIWWSLLTPQRKFQVLCDLPNQEKIPVTVQGSGTSTTGASLPVKGGIC